MRYFPIEIIVMKSSAFAEVCVNIDSIVELQINRNENSREKKHTGTATGLASQYLAIYIHSVCD